MTDSDRTFDQSLAQLEAAVQVALLNVERDKASGMVRGREDRLKHLIEQINELLAAHGSET